MHPSAMINGELFFKAYVAGREGLTVVDIGAQDVNGSLREVCPDNVKYIGVDFEKAKGVDVILDDPYVLPFADASVDVVVSSSCFEHSEMFWLVIAEIFRIMKPGGLFYLNVPANGVYHRYPLDCWRFYPDAGKGLVTWAKHCGYDAVLMESFVSNQIEHCWNDFVAVLLKGSEQVKSFPKRIISSHPGFRNGWVHGKDEVINGEIVAEDALRVEELKVRVRELEQKKSGGRCVAKDPEQTGILVTGGAGYIGSHVVLALAAAGYRPVVLDDLSTGRRSMVPPGVTFVHGSCADGDLVTRVLRGHRIHAVIHCAGRIRVDESMRDPLLYYRGNSDASRSLVEACVRENVRGFLFSSTAAVYGNPETVPVREDAPTTPINPYGRSKMVTEMMLADVAQAHGMPYVAMRYFNVAGADPQGRCGQVIPFVSHLIRRALHVQLGLIPRLDLFGTDYQTPDGTCIRDYIHVSDLADAHIACLRYLLDGGASRVVNCGYGHGFSVREVLREVERVTGKPLAVVEGPRREGDPACLVANADWLRSNLGWAPRFDNLGAIIADAYAWEKRELAPALPSLPSVPVRAWRKARSLLAAVYRRLR